VVGQVGAGDQQHIEQEKEKPHIEEQCKHHQHAQYGHQQLCLDPDAAEDTFRQVGEYGHGADQADQSPFPDALFQDDVHRDPWPGQQSRPEIKMEVTARSHYFCSAPRLSGTNASTESTAPNLAHLASRWNSLIARKAVFITKIPLLEG
jgi:hypothetical protein